MDQAQNVNMRIIPYEKDYFDYLAKSMNRLVFNENSKGMFVLIDYNHTQHVPLILQNKTNCSIFSLDSNLLVKVPLINTTIPILDCLSGLLLFTRDHIPIVIITKSHFVYLKNKYRNFPFVILKEKDITS